MGRLDGKVAIVTGAARGIGAAHARLLASEGAAVLVNDLGSRDGSTAEALAAEIRAAGGRAEANDASATWDGAADVVGAAVDAFGRVDVLINNASAARHNDFWQVTEEEWDLADEVTLKGYRAMMRAAVPHMARGGGGAIVNTSSGSGFGHPSYVPYATAKEGVVGLTRSAAMELGRFGIRCNAIRPMAVTQQFHEYRDDSEPWRELMDVTMGVSRAADRPEAVTPAMVSPFVVWLCTEAAVAVNGKSFLVMGSRVSLLSEPAPAATIRQSGGWTLDDLDAVAPGELVDGLENPYRLDDHPHLQAFPEHDG